MGGLREAHLQALRKREMPSAGGWVIPVVGPISGVSLYSDDAPPSGTDPRKSDRPGPESERGRPAKCSILLPIVVFTLFRELGFTHPSFRYRYLFVGYVGGGYRYGAA